MTEQSVDSILSTARASLEECDETPSVADEEFQTVDDELTRPSEYLRSRWPLCFGGKGGANDDFDAIVCLDACFTQKHNKQRTRDPLRQHPKTVFVPESEVREWEDFVKSVRPPKPTATTKKASRASETDDGFEGAIRVPNSVLNGCEQSFTAADETREKASGHFFLTPLLSWDYYAAMIEFCG